MNGPSGTVSYLTQVKDKKDGEGGAAQQQYEQQQKKKDQEAPEKFEVTDETVQAAISSFSSDTKTQSNGLTASQHGQGPGLKVVLKDGTGAVIRQFTGEEFLKLREAATKDNTGRGKILDQKL